MSSEGKSSVISILGVGYVQFMRLSHRFNNTLVPDLLWTYLRNAGAHAGSHADSYARSYAGAESFLVSLIVKYRFAEEKWYSRFTKAAKENYLEMGLLSFSVVFYTRKNGQLAVDMWVDTLHFSIEIL